MRGRRCLTCTGSCWEGWGSRDTATRITAPASWLSSDRLAGRERPAYDIRDGCVHGGGRGDGGDGKAGGRKRMTAESNTAESNLVGSFCRLYSVLLYAYPGDFRRQFGRSMEQLFRDRCRELAAGAGRMRLLHFAAHVV